MNFKFGIVVLLIALIIAPTPAAASRIITVGPEAGCDYSDIQDAFDAVQDHDEVHVSSHTFSGLHLHIVNRAVTIIGGFDFCSSPQSSGGRTILKGSGGGDSILLIDGSSNVTLNYFSFFGTVLNNASTHGAGINYRGHGSLTLEHVSISNNFADYGAGLNVSASDSTDVYLNEDTQIFDNTAYKQGGGINIEGKTKLYMLGKDSWISDNTAFGNGGGIQINGPAVAEIGSPSDVKATISRNKADYGGGVAIEPGGTLLLYSTDSANPVSVSDNTATQKGGGIHLAGNDHIAWLCGWVYGIDRNTAPDGAAIYSEGSFAALQMKASNSSYCAARLINPVACPKNHPCNTINDNISTNQGSGTIVLDNDDTDAELESFEMRRNTAYHAILHNKIWNYSSYSNCLIADNSLHSDILKISSAASDDRHTVIRACTFAQNTLDDGTPAIETDPAIDIRQSILWQPGHALVSGNGTRTGQHDIVSDSSAFFGLPDIAQVDSPGFISPGYDYHLRLSSPGIDYLALTELSYTGITLDGYPRATVVSSNRIGTPVDAGPYERQTQAPSQTFPLVENFDELDPTGAELPGGWCCANYGWVSTRDADASTAFAMHADDPGSVSQSWLISPRMAQSGLLIFRHKYQLEPTYDVALLEISFDDAAFQDVLDAGGRFVVGGYDNIMALGNPANPIQRVGKPVWSNDFGPGPYSTVKVVLPPVPSGHQIRLGWHVGSDGSGAHPGYWLDSIQLVTDAIFTDSAGG